MSGVAIKPVGFRRRREKVFGAGNCQPLDRNAKARIIVYARAWSARHKQPGQHRGPITRAYMQVLEALLWGFHNSRDGRCFPSYKTIAARAECNPDTVGQAIKALEAAKVLTWVNRLMRVSQPVLDLFGNRAVLTRVFRTSNSYRFHDHGSGLQPVQGRGQSPAQYREITTPTLTQSKVSLALTSKPENPRLTLNQDLLYLKGEATETKTDLDKALDKLEAKVIDKENSLTR